ncbi:uncharacterized protein LOC132945080 isoform X2 [Metopolophium dirhodum]|uniref:uncharacterized protein LOC132945080 isoform X2 n=1 Tax=Metopolophium dirhodum TaxID=44670 RepID=UPI00298F5BA2|nr:uncharacterized protein LOC132945080 isoform X2 [Metopolophium dirhodum]
MNRLLSVLLSVTLLLQVTVTVVSGQGQNATPSQCKCVPYYLCGNRRIDTSGKGLKDERFGGDFKCSNILDVCCNESMIYKKPEEKDKIIDKMIWEMISTPKPPTRSSDTCKCVPYYLCRNEAIVTSGKGLIDKRSGGLKCDGLLVKCCYKSMQSKASNDMDLTTQDIDKTILGEMSTPIPQSMPSDTCKCVPYYLCGNRRIDTGGKGLTDERYGGNLKCSKILDVCCNESMILEKPQERNMIIDKNIWEIFYTPKPPTLSSDTCKCVPYYLCVNGTIVTSGKRLIDEWSGGLKCDGLLVMCCYESMQSKASKDMDLTTQDIDKTILGEMSTPIPQSMPSDTCKCVPYYLCVNGTIVTSGKRLIDEWSGGLKCDGLLVMCCYESMQSKASKDMDLTTQDIDKTILGEMSTPIPQSMPSDTCKCVPYYLCVNGTIVTSGKRLIDEWSGGLKCDGLLVMCCYESMQSKASKDMDLTTQDIDKTILGEMSTPIPQSMPSDTCKCVPYYLCVNGTIVTSGKRLIDEWSGGLKCDGLLVMCCYESMQSKASKDMDLTTQDIDKTILGEMSTPIPQSMPSDTCKCVPYYLCVNGTIVTSGKRLIDEWSGGLKCDGLLVMCCYESMQSKASKDMDLTTQDIDKTILGEMSTPIPQSMPSDTCKCVPYYLCVNGTIVTSGKRLIDEWSGGLKCDGLLVMCCYESMQSKASKDMDLTTQDIDKTILGEMSTPIPQSMPSDTCKCVPYYLCVNGTIVTSGKRLIDEWINKDRCPNSVDVCCYDPIKSTKPTEIPDPEHRTICGHWNPLGVKNTITGESHNEAQFGEFPWMMAILKLEANQSKTYICGGSLIHPRVVLTAFHCVNGKNPNDLVIRAGEWDTQTENEPLPSQDGQALKIINHADFEPDELLNDVALIIVIKPFSLSKNVGTICLPSPNYVFSNRCYASGWGKKEFGELGVNQVIMKKIDLPIVPPSSCLELLRETRLGVDYILPESFICAGGEIGKDTCQGDGGSPLMCPIENRPKQFQQAGIVASGIGCGTKTPGVYVDVALFRNWIDEQMAKEKLSTIYYDPDYVPRN